MLNLLNQKRKKKRKKRKKNDNSKIVGNDKDEQKHGFSRLFSTVGEALGLKK